jgi:hypothetical protein
MADENINVKIKFDAQTGEIRRAIAEIAVLHKRLDKLSSGRTDKFANSTNKSLNSMTSGWKRSFDAIDKGAKMAGKGLTKFLGMSVKGVVVEMAILGATMIGIHALFAAGQFLVKAYRGAMQMLASGAAGVVVAISAASAAIREQQAAIYAYRGKGAPAFGSAMNQTRMAMRNLQSDAALSSLGVEALNKAYGNMSKSMNTSQINQSGGAIKALMDFGSAGQDPAKGLEQVSVVIAALSDKKKNISDVITEAKKLGPEMESALKKANVKTKKQFQELLMSGDLAKKGGVSGQFDAVNNTLISQMKGYFTRLRGEFADFGDQFLEPLKVAFARVFDKVRTDLMRVFAAIQYSFGAEEGINNFASAIEKASGWLVKMIREYLPAAIGMFDRIGDWYTKFKRGWNLVLDATRPLIDGAKVLYKALDPVWDSIKGGAQNLTLFKDLLEENSFFVEEFGQRIADIIDTLSEYFMGLKKNFAQMAPFINDLLAGLNQVFKVLTGIMTVGAGSGLGAALAPLMGAAVLGRGLAGVKGRLMPKSGNHTQNMNVTATNVSINNGAGPRNAGTTNEGRRVSSGSTASPMVYPGSSALGKISAPSVYGPSSQLSVFKASTNKEAFAAMRDTPNRRFIQNIRDGSKVQVRGSDFETRHSERFAERQAMGRGAGYAAFGQPKDPYSSPTIMGRDGKPQPNPQFNLAKSARFRAEQSLNGRSRRELHQIAADKGVTGITKKSTREEINRQILAKKGSVAEFKNDPRPVGIGTGISNDAKRLKSFAKGGASRVKYGGARALGGYRGAMSFLQSGAYDPETGEYKNTKEQRDEINKRYEKATSADTNRNRGSRMFAKLNRARETNRMLRNDSKFGAGTKKFNNSMGARAGVGIGLGMASQYAPEEMRGAMALGATVGTINPMLGLGVAGIGGAMKAQGAMKGALSGAAGGAALGGMLGPHGAAIGAGIGLLVGGIMGAVNKGKAQLAAAKATVMESLGELYMGTMKSANAKFQENYEASQRGVSLAGKSATMLGVGKGFAKTQSRIRGSVEGAIAGAGGSYMLGGKQEFANPVAALEAYYKTAEGSKVSEEDRKTQKKKATGTLRTLLEQTDPAVQKQLGEIDKQNSARIDALSRATGKSGAELEQMAKTMGVDLYNPTVQYTELLGKFTAGIIKTGAALNDALTDNFLAGANPFKETREKDESQAALNQNIAGLGDVLRGKGSKAEKSKAIGASMEQQFAQLLAVNGGDATKAYLSYNEMYGQGETGGLFAKGAALEGQGKTVLQDKDVIASQAAIKEGAVGNAAEQIRARLADKGMTVAPGVLEAKLSGKTPQELTGILENISNFDKDSSVPKGGEQNKLKKAIGGETAADVTTGLEGLLGSGVTVTAEDPDKLNKIADAATDFSTAAKGLETAVTTFNTNMDGFFKAPLGNAPGWWSAGLKVTGTGDDMRLMPGDTSTPRGGAIGDTATSKLSQTMGRHAAMNGQLTGKRTVTSSLRDYALGSINSDHATGSAYDLTGQNLGQYAKLVHANGGFAEFHGSMANRHLHVVPGAGKMGDTATSTPVSTASSSGGGTNNYYTFEINGNNAAPEVIANMVMAKIQEKERSNRQRT